MSRIKCEICDAEVHAVAKHLKEAHSDWSIDRYRDEFPSAPTLSEAAKKKLAQSMLDTSKSSAATMKEDDDFLFQPLHEVFELGEAPAAKSASGSPIPIAVRKHHDYEDMVPVKDEGFVFNIDILKTVLMGMQNKMPIYLWGHAGTGKTTLPEQVCAHTNRSLIRVQHTLNMEESNVIGQWGIKGGETVFQPGLLPMAMRYGWTYLADEYDFAVPHVLSIYQPVLEGKNLVIKDAPPEWRVVEPHPEFLFVATGNTNGVGDETGLYQGTQIQNAANYERFSIVEKVEYMDPKLEKQIIVSKAKLAAADAKKMVDFATKIRDNDEISMPISPRALINAGKLGTFKGSLKRGLELAYMNRLPSVEREVASQLAQRFFGE